MSELQTPVALIIFNRPHLLRQVWEVIRAARPRRLFVVADGPRPDHPEDAALCAECRAIAAEVDWPCHVARNYAETNVGCDPRIASGITWVFSQAEEAIILEDDILPDPSFFPYCQTLLAHYRDDERVMGIGGFNFLGKWRNGAGDYHLHRWIVIWGWATWRRAWRHFDHELDRYPRERIGEQLLAHFSDPQQADYQVQIFDTYAHQPSMPWDTKWSLLCNLLGGLWISPGANLITNLGFGVSASHTTNTDDLRRFVQRSSAPSILMPPSENNVGSIDEHLGRWLFLIEVLNTYRNIPALHLWQNALEKNHYLPCLASLVVDAHFWPPCATPPNSWPSSTM